MLLLWHFLICALVAAGSETFCDQTTLTCYSLHPEPSNYSAANYYCNSLHGQLASIGNASDLEFLAGIAFTVFDQKISSDYWIGANFFLMRWAWVDGTEWSFKNWDTGEPLHQAAASMEIKTGKWITAQPTEKKPFACSVSPPLEPVCEDGWAINRDLMFCYYIIFEVTFQKAEVQCLSLGAHLTSIHSSLENDFVTDLTKAGYVAESGKGETWIGLSYNASNWQWTDGTRTNYFHWSGGEPPKNTGNNCVQLYSDDVSTTNHNFWSYADCISDKRAVCKKPPQMKLKIN